MCFGVELPLECEEQGPSPLFIDFQLCPCNWLHDWKESCLWRHVLFPGGGCDVTHVCDGLPKKKKKKKKQILKIKIYNGFYHVFEQKPLYKPHPRYGGLIYPISQKKPYFKPWLKLEVLR